ncbi:MAG: hypothetical protein LIP05_11390 [Tannerellaceae bacterium]|nr:hypothetical protein [Tannerellaceae bacterium]
MRIIILLWIYMVGFSGNMMASEKPFEDAVRTAVERQITTYPKSTLKDLYKNFFQDKYGPGHIISDTTGAGNYLRRELSTMTSSDGELVEPTGWEGNFYRVNLSLIKEGRIPYDVFFDAFIRSVNGIEPPPVPVWKEEWENIEIIISSWNLRCRTMNRIKQRSTNVWKKGNLSGITVPYLKKPIPLITGLSARMFLKKNCNRSWINKIKIPGCLPIQQITCSLNPGVLNSVLMGLK